MKHLTVRLFSYVFGTLFFGVIFPTMVSAATLYLDPDNGEYHPGDTFVVSVRLDANGDCVNVVSGEVSYPKDLLRASAFSQGESILTLWTETPKINGAEGRVSFTGGVPGGYCGRIAGDPGYANIVGKIIFSVLATAPVGATPMIEALPSSQVLLADGRGTPASLLVNKATFRIASGTGRVVNEWLDELRDDTVPPEPFAIDLHHDARTAGGKYFVVFQTTDKQSGVVKYELKEHDKDRPEYIRGERTLASWRPVESPYVLEDQTLNSTIIIRAIDNAGQIREESFLPSGDGVNQGSTLPYAPIIGGVVLFLVAIAVTVRMRKGHPHSP